MPLLGPPPTHQHSLTTCVQPSRASWYCLRSFPAGHPITAPSSCQLFPAQGSLPLHPELLFLRLAGPATKVQGRGGLSACNAGKPQEVNSVGQVHVCAYYCALGWGWPAWLKLSRVRGISSEGRVGNGSPGKKRTDILHVCLLLAVELWGCSCSALGLLQVPLFFAVCIVASVLRVVRQVGSSLFSSAALSFLSKSLAPSMVLLKNP
jgi:hypothetical protein